MPQPPCHIVLWVRFFSTLIVIVIVIAHRSSFIVHRPQLIPYRIGVHRKDALAQEGDVLVG